MAYRYKCGKASYTVKWLIVEKMLHYMTLF